MPSCKILQRYTIGDCLYLNKLAQVLLEKDYQVYWPIHERISFIPEYISHPNLIWEDGNTDLTIDCQNAKEYNHPFDILTTKYRLASEVLGFEITDKDWQDYIKIKRNQEREKELLDWIDGPFTLISENYGEHQKISLPRPIRRNWVELRRIPHYTLFDWIGAIEKAEGIWCADSSINYLVEVFNKNGTDFRTWPRHPIHTKQCLEGIFNRKNWGWQ
jgi:hypothetical protein